MAAYGKSATKGEANSVGTVTETGNAAGSEAEKRLEVIESIGAGDGI
ncbi:MAG TPA: hypothetical protein VJQ25_02915 [Nitrospira sp.]|nr:hypothetical protein [Nitrospira sp.]